MFASHLDLGYAFYGDRASSVVNMFIYPANLGRMIAQISSRTLSESAFDPSRNGSMPGYHWSDLWDPRLYPSQIIRKDVFYLSPAWNVFGLALCAVSGLVFAWYLDTACAGETGISEGLLFPFRASVRLSQFCLSLALST
jgi:hypothetical protein